MSDDNMTLQELKDRIHAFHVERQWDEEDPKDIALSIVLEAAEVLELFQWKLGEEVKGDGDSKIQVGEEMVDVIWYVVMMSNRLGIDLSQAFERKYEINAKRWPKELFKPGVTKKERELYYRKAKSKDSKGSPGRSGE